LEKCWSQVRPFCPAPFRSYLDPVKAKEAKGLSRRVTGAQWAYTASRSNFGFLYRPEQA